MRVVVYVTAMPVPDRYRYRFPVVRHDVDRLAVSVIELPEKLIDIAEAHGYVVPAITPAFRLVYIRMAVTFAGMYFVFNPFSLGALVASTTNSVPYCPHLVRAHP